MGPDTLLNRASQAGCRPSFGRSESFGSTRVSPPARDDAPRKGADPAGAVRAVRWRSSRPVPKVVRGRTGSALRSESHTRNHRPSTACLTRSVSWPTFPLRSSPRSKGSLPRSESHKRNRRVNGMPDAARSLCRLADISAKSVLLQVVRQERPEKMTALVEKMASQGGGTTRKHLPEATTKPTTGCPKALEIFAYRPPAKLFNRKLSFTESRVHGNEIIGALEATSTTSASRNRNRVAGLATVGSAGGGWTRYVTESRIAGRTPAALGSHAANLSVNTASLQREMTRPRKRADRQAPHERPMALEAASGISGTEGCRSRHRRFGRRRAGSDTLLNRASQAGCHPPRFGRRESSVQHACYCSAVMTRPAKGCGPRGRARAVRWLSSRPVPK